MNFRRLCSVDSVKLRSPRTCIAIHLPISVLVAAMASGIAITLTPTAHAATLINNAGVQFERDTLLETNFVESHGAYQSVFGVINLDTKEKMPLLIETKPSDDPGSIFYPSSKQSHLGTSQDFRGTPGNTVQQPVATYNFKAGNRYVFYLESTYNGRPTGILYSTNSFNPNREQQAQFTGSPTELCTTGMTIAWDDTGSRLVRNRKQQDRDFDDFVVNMRQSVCAIGGGEKPPVVAAVPPPPSVAPIPAAVRGRRGGAEWGLLALPLLAFLGGDDSGGRGGGGGGGGGSVGGGIGGGGGGLPPGNSLGPNRPPNNEAVPEPMTILGSGIAIGAGSLFQRRRNRQKKKGNQPKS